MLSGLLRRQALLRTLLGGIAALGLLALGYLLIKLLHLDGNLISAVGTALAAFAAFGAAEGSRRTAQDATLALALATKPDVRVSLDVGTVTDYRVSTVQFSINLENFSVHATGPIEVEWRLRDGAAGSRMVDPLEGRSYPAGGMFHSKGPTVSFEIGVHDTYLQGTDVVTCRYWDASRLRCWERQAPYAYGPSAPEVSYPPVERKAVPAVRERML